MYAYGTSCIYFRGRDMKRDMVDAYGFIDITPSMFLTSMNAIVEKYETKKQKVIFIVVTDNPLFIQKFYMPRLKKAFNVYQIGSGHVNNRISVGLDMAILSRCNVTMLSYGTYSFWGGFLSGGPKILPFHMSSPYIKWNGTQPLRHQDSFTLPDAGIEPKRVVAGDYQQMK